ncbi:hypothetical protein B0H10DRAFT_2232385 [Mycena sp. CBHHK59/15]|nr:hypothetical protein B0H10DRAFT_2232385 [Mycena sp. CBHHK59/15]
MAPTATNAPTPDEEMAALLAQVAALSKLALDVTRHCININDQIPRVIRAQVDKAVAEIHPASPEFVLGITPTPDELEAKFPPGHGDNQTWYVVCVGRRPGLHATSEEADAQVLGVPHQFRRKKDSHVEALAFYRHKHSLGEVMQISEVVPVPTAPARS